MMARRFSEPFSSHQSCRPSPCASHTAMAAHWLHATQLDEFPMKTTPRSEIDAQQASRRTLLPAGWYEAQIQEACERPSKRGSEMIELALIISDAHGSERTFRDWLTDSTLGAVKLRHACEAVSALDKYEAGEISQADFP